MPSVLTSVHRSDWPSDCDHDNRVYVNDPHVIHASAHDRKIRGSDRAFLPPATK